MKLFNFIVVSIALGRSTVFAVPINEERDLVCLAHTILINVLTLNHGEKFCFDYLNIQTSTILTTTTKKTTTTQVLPAVTTTTTLFTGTETRTSEIHITSLVTATSTLSVFETLTSTDVVTVTSTTTLAPQKRSTQLGARTIPLPPYLALWPASQVSAACKCLNVPTPRITAVITASETSTILSTPPVVTSVLSTFALATITTTLVDIVTQVEVLTVTNSNTVTVTTTTTAITTETPRPI